MTCTVVKSPGTCTGLSWFSSLFSQLSSLSERLRKEEGKGEWLEGPWWPCWGLGCSPEDGRGCHGALVKEGCGQTRDSGR